MIVSENFREIEKWLWVGENLKAKIHGKRVNEIISRFHGKGKSNILKFIYLILPIK